MSEQGCLRPGAARRGAKSSPPPLRPAYRRLVALRQACPDTLAGGLWGSGAAPPPACPADLNGDNTVDVGDIMKAANGWRKQAGEAGYDARVDRNGDNKITVDEIQWIAARWGTC